MSQGLNFYNLMAYIVKPGQHQDIHMYTIFNCGLLQMLMNQQRYIFFLNQNTKIRIRRWLFWIFTFIFLLSIVSNGVRFHWNENTICFFFNFIKCWMILYIVVRWFGEMVYKRLFKGFMRWIFLLHCLKGHLTEGHVI